MNGIEIKKGVNDCHWNYTGQCTQYGKIKKCRFNTVTCIECNQYYPKDEYSND